MQIIRRILLLFTHGPELEELVNNMKIKKSDELRKSRLYNLNLCIKHKQEHNHSIFSEHNCNYCQLLKEVPDTYGKRFKTLNKIHNLTSSQKSK